MNEINKKGFVEGHREVIRRSNIYWKNMDVIKQIMYANNYTHFWTDRAKEIQSFMRSKAPGVVGDWYRFEFEGYTLTFTLSDDAIRQYQPIVREFASFGSAVKILASYENYFQEIIESIISKYAPEVGEFSTKYKINKCEVKNFLWVKLHRGLIIIQEIFGHTFHPSYGPCINFFFELRNVAIHNNNLADEKLCAFACSEFIKTDKPLRVGDRVEWSLSSVFKLHQLVMQILDEVDAVVQTPLKLDLSDGTRHWYYRGKK